MTPSTVLICASQLMLRGRPNRLSKRWLALSAPVKRIGRVSRRVARILALLPPQPTRPIGL